MKPCRPILGKLKWIMAHVQSQTSKLPPDEIEVRQLGLLNYELNKLHLSCDSWPKFVWFVQHPSVNSKSVSNLLRHARTASARQRSLITMRLEDIMFAIQHEIPFKLLMTNEVTSSYLEFGQRRQPFCRGYLLGLFSAIEHCKKLKIKIPLR